MNPKILVLVLHSDKQPWADIGRVQRETWMSDIVDGVECLHYVGRSSSVFVKDQCLFLTDEDGNIDRLGVKTKTAFKWALENRDFDYIFRTNTSSYVDMEMLREFLSGKPRNRYYGGTHVKSPSTGITFASGCGFAVSRDLVSMMVDSQSTFSDNYPDDLEIGLFFVRNGIKVENHPRTDLTRIFKVRNWRNGGRKKSFHYRCKAPQRSGRPEWESILMREIHSTFRKEPK